MIWGEVNAGRQAVVRLDLRGRNGQQHGLDATLDTGFTGFVTLPLAVIAALQFPFRETSAFTLGDGSDVVFDVYVATVLWDEQERNVFALATEGGPLVGMSLLYGHRLTMDVVDGGLVVIEPL